MLSPPQLGERTQARFGRVPIFGNCVGMRRHLAARKNINPGLARPRSDLDAGSSHTIGLDRRVHGNLPDVMLMIRVTKTEERSRTVVTIDGQLSCECVTVVETCCSQAESKRKPVYVFLRDVTTVDQAGTVLLRRLAAKGIRLLARGIYTSYLVQTLASRDPAAQFSSSLTRHPDPNAPRRTL
jgi:hypothetical protein